MMGVVAVILFLAFIALSALALFAPESASKSNDLLEARAGFSTLLIPSRIQADGPPEQPPPGVFNLVRYPSPAGNLAAYLTPAPKNIPAGRPAILWLKGGWGGIGGFLWDRESGEAPTAFREAGFVVMCPSFRGENDNPGRIEAFYGEVDDVLAAYHYLAALPYVDRERVYIAGYSTGGTLAILASMASVKPRAVFSFGGRLDTASYLRIKGMLAAMPFNWLNSAEIRLRNPIEFAASLKTPLYCFEGEDYADPEAFLLMERGAREHKKNYAGYIIRHADHFNYVPLATYWLADALLQDRAGTFSAPIRPQLLQEAFNRSIQ